MSNYFKNFPLIDYPGVGLAKNIVSRAAIKVDQNQLITFFISNGLRPDTIADRYYGDDDLDWVVYFTNNIIDPYYEFCVSDESLLEQITQKHGSIDVASHKIMFWQSNWKTDGGPISLIQYNSLPVDVKPYYNAHLGANGVIVEYRRKRKTIIKQTNMIVRYQLASNLTLAPGTVVSLGTIDRATVVSCVGNIVTVQHVIGNWNATLINGIAVTSVLMKVNSISDTEAPYFEYVSAYEAEFITNNIRRNIKLVSSDQAGTLGKELKRALS